jgi:hypothetical protein
VGASDGVVVGDDEIGNVDGAAESSKVGAAVVSTVGDVVGIAVGLTVRFKDEGTLDKLPVGKVDGISDTEGS